MNAQETQALAIKINALEGHIRDEIKYVAERIISGEAGGYVEATTSDIIRVLQGKIAALWLLEQFQLHEILMEELRVTIFNARKMQA